MSKINTSKASLANMILNGTREWPGKNSVGVTAYWKKKSSKAERAAARTMTNTDNVHAELLEDAELREALGNDHFEGLAFIYGRDFSWR